METLLNFYRRLDRLQRTLRFRVAGSVIVVLLAAAVFAPLLVKCYELREQRLELGRALAGQNYEAGDEHAVSLAEDGTVTVGGRTWGGEHLKRRAHLYFDEDGAIVPSALIEDLLAGRKPAWAPSFLLEQPDTAWIVAVLGTGFLLLVVWMEVALAFALVLVGTGVLGGSAAAAGSAEFMLAFAGMGLLTFAFVLLTRVVMLLFQAPHQVFAVAHAVVKEASRSRLSLVFVVLMLICLPLLPMTLDPDAPLRFRIQTFISRSLLMTYTLAACMTLFLACATVAFEIRDRQIWQLMTKPLGRFNYLLGKWLGVLSVNAVLLAIAGLSIFVFIKYLKQLPVEPGMAGVLDRLAVNDEVLTARDGARPIIRGLTAEQLRARVEQRIREDPQLSQRDALDDVSLAEKRRMARELQEQYINQQRSVPPYSELRPGGNERAYTFTGLGRAKELQSTLTLRYRFHILRDDEHQVFPVMFEFNGDPDTRVMRQYTPTVSHFLPIGTDMIREDGTMEIAINNLYVPRPDEAGLGELNFEPDDFELLYKVGGFEWNFFRAVLVSWVKLGFLAMLGICTASLVSFPVACLTTFTIFIAATVGPFLAMSLEEYYVPASSQIDSIGMAIRWGFQSAIKWTARALVVILHNFGEYRPTQSLVEGRLISWRHVLAGVFWLGVVWSGIALVIGWLVVRSRQLAIYSGHG